jgi:hypothetical protein
MLLLEAHLKREEPEHSLPRLGMVLSRLVVIVGEFLESKAPVMSHVYECGSEEQLR